MLLGGQSWGPGLDSLTPQRVLATLSQVGGPDRTPGMTWSREQHVTVSFAGLGVFGLRYLTWRGRAGGTCTWHWGRCGGDGWCTVSGCGSDDLRRRKEGVKVVSDYPASGDGQGQTLPLT